MADNTVRAHKAGREWFADLDVVEKDAIGDDMVLGTFDWADWFDDPPPRGFMAGVEQARLEFEMGAE